MIVEAVRKHVDTSMHRSLVRTAQRHGFFPLTLSKVKLGGVKGWSITPIYEGMYSSAEVAKYMNDARHVKHEEEVVGLVYTVPVHGGLDSHGKSLGDVLLVGMHMRDHRALLPTKNIFYDVRSLGLTSPDLKFIERQYHEILDDYLLGQGIEKGTPEEEVAEIKFDTSIWERALKPKYRVTTIEGGWGRNVVPVPLVANPFL